MKWRPRTHAMTGFSTEIRVGVPRTPETWRPPADVFECDDAYVIKLAISGLRRDATGRIENAEVVVEGNSILVQGHIEDCCTPRKCSYYQMEIPYGRFECRVEIDAPFDARRIEAEYRDGFLLVTLPKRTPTAPRRIHVGR